MTCRFTGSHAHPCSTTKTAIPRYKPFYPVLNSTYRPFSKPDHLGRFAARGAPLPRDTDDFVNVFLLFDRVQHERSNGFARQCETHLGRGTFPASISHGIFLSETRGPCDRPVETVGLDDCLHRKRVTHVISHDETRDSIRNPREMRRRR